MRWISLVTCNKTDDSMEVASAKCLTVKCIRSGLQRHWSLHFCRVLGLHEGSSLEIWHFLLKLRIYERIFVHGSTSPNNSSCDHLCGFQSHRRSQQVLSKGELVYPASYDLTKRGIFLLNGDHERLLWLVWNPEVATGFVATHFDRRQSKRQTQPTVHHCQSASQKTSMNSLFHANKFLFVSRHAYLFWLGHAQIEFQFLHAWDLSSETPMPDLALRMLEGQLPVQDTSQNTRRPFKCQWCWEGCPTSRCSFEHRFWFDSKWWNRTTSVLLIHCTCHTWKSIASTAWPEITNRQEGRARHAW